MEIGKFFEIFGLRPQVGSFSEDSILLAKAADQEAGRLKIWRALNYAEWGMNRAAFAEDMTEMRAFIHALSQVAGQYAKIIEAGEMAAEIELLKAQPPMRRVA